MQDDRILNPRERELLANVLRRVRSYDEASEDKVARSVARAIGETVAQRAFSLLGEQILQGLEGSPRSSVELLDDLRLGTGPLPVPTPPSPDQPGPRPPSPSPPTSPNGISARRRENSVAPFGGPQPPTMVSASSADNGGVGVLECTEILPAQCVVFEEFLVPAELEGSDPLHVGARDRVPGKRSSLPRVEGRNWWTTNIVAREFCQSPAGKPTPW